MSSYGSRPRRSTPGSPRTSPPSDRGAFGGNSFREYRSHRSRDNSGSRSSDPRNDRDTLEPPPRDGNLIKKMYKNVNLPAWIADDPKDFLTEFASQVPGTTLNFKYQVGMLNNQRLWRTTVTLESGMPMVGEGDSPTKVNSEKLAVLSVVCQLVQRSLPDHQGKIIKSLLPQSVSQGVERTLSDNKTNVDYDCARQFISHYVQKLGFGREDIECNLVGGSNERGGGVWEAFMTICGGRLGFGCGPTKELAQKACYVEAAVYLEAHDPNLWKTYVEETETGRDLCTIPPAHFSITEPLKDEIYELCTDMKKSTLYRNALRLRPSSLHSNSSQTTPGAQPLFRRSLELLSFEEKDRILKERREKYLTSPAMKSMRDSRAALPVVIHSRALLDHIRDNDVTICMATTGSGKTTQVPQLILDDHIDRGEGSRCNIICTQPYHLAAVSAARRVARERGERLGASVGYQVVPWGQLPEERGSITFCTTVIFFPWMKSASGAFGTSAQAHSLDDVTHIVVDEVHERDVNTDLLLAMLKRLLADRTAKGKPIKVILMSATTDPTLFQQYFLDEKCLPSKVIEIPGRTFPVKKHFLDGFASDLASTPGASEAFAQPSVAEYVHNELGPMALRSCPTPPPVFPTGRDKSELEVPAPLVALTIAHVMRRSDDGHILTFLSGRGEIERVRWYIADPASGLALDFGDSTKWSIHLLHSSISVEEREGIFEPPKGVRRIILASNVAETSVAIPGVSFVVDAAEIKEQRFDPERRIPSLVSAWVSSSSLNQRAGCAGRCRSGEYFGIISQKRASELHPYQTVEMKRVDLSNIVMRVKALNLPGMSVEDVLSEAIEPPAAGLVAAAMKDLTMVGALDTQKELTPLGKILLQLPVGVQVGRLMVLGTLFKCLDHALTLAAILINRDPPVIKVSSLEDPWVALDSPDLGSDALTVLRAYGVWDNRREWEGDVTPNPFLMIKGIKDHLLKGLFRAGVIDARVGMIQQACMGSGMEGAVPPELNINQKSTPLLVALISAASQPNLAVRIGYNIYRTPQDEAVFLHPSSVNHRKKDILPRVNASSREGHIIAFMGKIQDTSVVTKYPREFIVTTTRLEPMSYMLFGARSLKVVRRGLECDEWLPIIGNLTALDQVSRLKEVMDLCFLRVCEGIVVSQVREGEGDIDDDEIEQAHERGLPLSGTEIEEFECFTEGLVRILDRYDDESCGIAPESTTNSRPTVPVNSRPAVPVVQSPDTRPSRLRQSSSGGLRRTRPHSRSSRASRNSSISEGHQSPEDDGESKKKVAWYDEALGQSSPADPTSWPLKPRTSDPSMSAPGVSTTKDSATRPLDLVGEGSTWKAVLEHPERTSRGRKVKKVLSRIFSSQRPL